MPVYNERNTVVEAIEHAKKVDLGPYGREIIVVDDGSTDGSRELIGGVAGVRKVFMPKNGGKGSALKEGIKHATGDYVVFHDADLEYEPGDFRHMLPILDSGLADIVIGSRLPCGEADFFFREEKSPFFLLHPQHYY